MITTDKTITTPAYWDRIYAGKNDAPVDSSHNKRPKTAFDRFEYAAELVDGNGPILDVGSGHAHVCKRLKKRYPDLRVVASDQSPAAKTVANYEPYVICSGYSLPFQDDEFRTVVVTQALEYMEDERAFLAEAKRVGKFLVCTVPEGEMAKWSQLRSYDVLYLHELLSEFGEVEDFDADHGLIRALLNFYPHD